MNLRVLTELTSVLKNRIMCFWLYFGGHNKKLRLICPAAVNVKDIRLQRINAKSVCARIVIRKKASSIVLTLLD